MPARSHLPWFLGVALAASTLAGCRNDSIAITACEVPPDGPPAVPMVFVFAGESNSGGLASNAEATAEELAARPSVQIMNLYSGTFDFEDLHIGFNNLVDHAGISDNPEYVPAPPNDILVHGMELGLANAVEAGAFGRRCSVYLVKTGQGGSSIEEWDAAGPYWAKFLQRTDAAKDRVPANTRWIVWYSQGINDTVYGVPRPNWKAATVEHLAKIRAQLPGCQIILTEFQSMPKDDGYPQLNAAIRGLVAADPTLSSVATDGAGTDGAIHWSYAGFRDVVVPAMVAATRL